MAKVIKVNPTSPGRRFLVKISREGIYSGRPHKALVKSSPRLNGRNNQGRITVRHRGGGHKKLIRQLDFRRIKSGIEGKIERIEYDPIRTAYIALVLYKDGERNYMLAPQKLSVGDTVISGAKVPIQPGNCLPLRNIPLGTMIHAIELIPGAKGKIARSAGSMATLRAREDNYALVRLPSGEVRKFHVDCKATVGVPSNPENNLKVLGKAGAVRWRGKRPTVRGVAMNPVDHPMGGGEGKSSGGRHPTSPTGKREKKTRSNKRTDSFIVTKRVKKRKNK